MSAQTLSAARADLERAIWPKIPKAAAILAECAVNPPATRTIKVVGLTTYHAEQYVGPPVNRLRAIKEEEAGRLLAEADATGNYDAFDAHCAYSVQTAIADAIFLGALADKAGSQPVKMEEAA
jgi:hypothetical protein